MENVDVQDPCPELSRMGCLVRGASGGMRVVSLLEAFICRCSAREVWVCWAERYEDAKESNVGCGISRESTSLFVFESRP